MAVPYQPVSMSSLVGPPKPGMDPRIAQAALAGMSPRKPSEWVDNMLPGGGPSPDPQGSRDSLSTVGPAASGLANPGQGGMVPVTGPRREGQGPSNPNAPIPGLPQPTQSNTRTTSMDAPNGNPMTSQASMADPGMPPGTNGNAAKLVFGFGDDLTTPQLQAIQKALVDSLQNQHQVNEAFQKSKKKPMGGMMSKTPGMGGMGVGTSYQSTPQGNGSMTPFPVPQSSPNDPWTGPSSR